MRDNDLKHILSEENIIPSSGFVASVMEAVRHEAAAPPPIPFPWIRALPGLAAATLTLVSFIVEISRSTANPEFLTKWIVVLRATSLPALSVFLHSGFGWLALALLLSLASVTVSLRLAPGTWQYHE